VIFLGGIFCLTIGLVSSGAASNFIGLSGASDELSVDGGVATTGSDTRGFVDWFPPNDHPPLVEDASDVDSEVIDTVSGQLTTVVSTPEVTVTVAVLFQILG
jgi:hypothetical protein